MNSTLNGPCCLPDADKKRSELSVLFHLVDVSRPRVASRPEHGPTLPIEPQSLFSAASAIVPPPDPPPSFLSPSVSDQPMLAVIEPPAATQNHYVTPPAETPLPLPPLAAAEPSVTAQIASILQNDLSPVETKPADKSELSTPQDQVTPANQTNTRRRTKTPASEEWFASQGKYIAIAFALALIGTVYFARNNRRQEVSADAGSYPQSPLADHKPVDSQSPAADPAKVQTVSVVSDSKVELHPPVATELAAEISTKLKSPGSDKLFDFPATKKADERLAARPDGAKSNETPTSAEKAAPGSTTELKTPAAPPTTPSAAPPLAPTYPATSSPAIGYPTTSVAPSGYPLTASPPLVGTSVPAGPPQMPTYAAGPQAAPSDPRYNHSQFPATAAPYQPQPQPQPPSQAWQSQAWAPPSAGPPGQYQPVQTARGPRNERIGSGNY